MYTPPEFVEFNKWAGEPIFYYPREVDFMNINSLITEVDALVTPVVESLGYDLIELEYLTDQGRWILRLYIDGEAGITLEDCEKVSRSVSAVLDVEDIIPGHFNLEVSSPGVERPVRRLKDFEKYVGSVVKIKTHNKISEQRNFTGVIKGISEGAVHISENGRDIKIPIEEISKARLQQGQISGGK